MGAYLMPRKTFVARDTLLASEVNTFLMDQAVMVFADAAARTTALPSPSEGMVTYLQDVDLIQVWTGAEWDEVSGAGITVSATAPVSPDEGDLWFHSELGSTFVWYVDTDGGQWVEIGAGSGPTAAAVSTTAPASAEQGQLWFDSETGNLYFWYVDVDGGQWIQVRSAAPAPTNLDELTDVVITLATSGDVLQYDGTDWVNAAGGKVLQVLSTTKTDTFTTTSSSYTDLTGLSVSITPSSTTSKVLVVADIEGASTSATTNSIGGYQILRDATAIGIGTTAGSRSSSTGQISTRLANNLNMASSSKTVLDSPNTTSAITYKVQVKVFAGTLYINRTDADVDEARAYRTVSSLTVMEVAG